MATLPDVPVNTIVAMVVVAGTGLAALNTLTRAKLDNQIHDNYRHAKVIDANVAGAEVASITEKSHRSA